MTEGPISYKDISNRWRFSVYNDKPGQPLPLKTFHNWCISVAELIGVDVENEQRGSYRYFIKEPAESEKWKFDFLNQLLMFNAVREDPSLSDRIMIKDVAAEKDLPQFVEFLRKRSIISFTMPLSAVEWADAHNCRPFSIGYRAMNEQMVSEGHHFKNFLVLGLVQVHLTWFVVGAFIEPRKPLDQCRISPFALFRLVNIQEQTDVTYNEKISFSIDDYIQTFTYDKEDIFHDGRPRLERDLYFDSQKEGAKRGLIPKGYSLDWL